MKVINRLNEKVIAEVVTNRYMTIEEALELAGIELINPDDEGAYKDADGEPFWLEDCDLE